jgi:hypothetical protein
MTKENIKKRLDAALKVMHDEVKEKGYCELATPELAITRSKEINEKYDIETRPRNKQIQIKK